MLTSTVSNRQRRVIFNEIASCLGDNVSFRLRTRGLRNVLLIGRRYQRIPDIYCPQFLSLSKEKEIDPGAPYGHPADDSSPLMNIDFKNIPARRRVCT